MNYSYVCRVSLPYDEVQSFIDTWSAKITSLLVYEHEADEKVKTTHCHFLIQDSEVQDEQLKRYARQKFPALKGNGSWAWKVYDPEKGKTYISYMTKGNLACKFNKNFSPDLLERSRLAWVEPVLGNDKRQGSSTSHKKPDDIDELYIGYVLKHDINDHDVFSGFTDTICERILSTCRTFTMAHVYHKTGKLPFPGTYKQTAGTLFLRVIEKQRPELFQEALIALKNLWY